MAELNELVTSLRALEAAITESATLSDLNFREHRSAIVDMRRQIAAHRAKVTTLIDGSIDSPDIRAAFRSRFSDTGSALATHQAAWPISAIDLENPDYLASRKSLRATNQAFFQWAKGALNYQ